MSDCRERCPSVPREFDVIHGFGMPRAAFPTTEEVKIYFLVVAEVVDHYRISSIFKASDCSVGFPHPTEKDEAENNVGRFARCYRI